jgi:hypothetical protein
MSLSFRGKANRLIPLYQKAQDIVRRNSRCRVLLIGIWFEERGTWADAEKTAVVNGRSR